MTVDVYDVPPPDTPQAIAERQRKHLAAVVVHNPRIDTDTARSIYQRRFPDSSFEDRLKECMRRGWLRRGKHGWVPTEEVQ